MELSGASGWYTAPAWCILSRRQLRRRAISSLRRKLCVVTRTQFTSICLGEHDAALDDDRSNARVNSAVFGFALAHLVDRHLHEAPMKVGFPSVARLPVHHHTLSPARGSRDRPPEERRGVRRSGHSGAPGATGTRSRMEFPICHSTVRERDVFANRKEGILEVLELIFQPLGVVG